MIRGNKVILRAYKEDDIELAHRFINDIESKKLLAISVPFPITIWEEEKWIKSTGGNDLTYDFAIEDIDTGRYIGGCSINQCDLKNRNCVVGIFIGDKNYWGKGFGTEALKLLVDFIFNEVNMNKIKLEVFGFNVRAIKSYKKVGFKEEGIFKEELFRNGKYHDVIRMCILSVDYFK